MPILRALARRLRLALVLALPLALWWHWPAPAPRFDRGTNGLWMSRHALHAIRPVDTAALVARLRAHGITRIYPFLGPPDTVGHPGWRDGRRHVRVEPEVAARFLASMRQDGPEIAVLPWTGGVWNEQIFLDDPRQRARLFDHLAALVEAGAAGIHVNVEPLPEGDPAFLAWLRALRVRLPRAELSVAAFPPPWPLRAASPVNWSLAWHQQLCGVVDELVIMGYDTGLPVGRLYEALVARWTAQLAEALDAGPCRWSMGVPAYEDLAAWHDPEAEALIRALRGVRRGLPDPAPANFSGVSLYAAWTVDAGEWAQLHDAWRGRPRPALPGPRLAP